MRYTKSMAKDISFQLDINAASVILTDLAAPIVKQSADAIASRAQSMASSMTNEQVGIEVFTSIGSIKRGKRAIATVKVSAVTPHGRYIGHQALTKAKDAGRV